MLKQMRPFQSYKAKYALCGTIFGLLFPTISYFILDHHHLLFGVICTAPFVLAVFSALAGIKQDNVEQKVLEKTRELQEAKDRAEEGIKAKARFLATMSHEIRTPMNAVLSCTNLLLDSQQRPENIKLLNVIQTSGDTLLTLINDILDFSKIESGKMDLENEPFCLSESVIELVDLLKPKASEGGATIYFKKNTSLPNWVKGDVTRFRQLLTNLIGNAIKFTKNVVEVSAESVSLGDGLHEITFAVKDNGIGMPPEAKKKLFQDFSQIDASTTRKFGGTGLGLAICKGIVDAMGGTIWAESELNKGSTFFFKFTVSETSAGEKRKSIDFSNIDSKMGQSHPLKILMAEDNSVNQLVARKILSKLGYRIDIVANGLEALDAFKHNEYDLILMDQHMPEMDGIEATIAIRHSSKSQPKIYALTASAFKEDKDRCLKAGMDGFLTKPINTKELITVLKDCKANEGMKANIGLYAAINEELLQEQFIGAEEILGQIAEQSLALIPQYLESINEALQSQDSQALHVAAHTLKGTVANFHAQSAFNAALALELSGKNNDFQHTQEQLKQLSKEIDLLLIDLKKIAAPQAA